MATLVDPGRIGIGKYFIDQYGGNPSSVIYGQPLVSYQDWQFAGWYGPDNSVQLARKDPSGTWTTITLPISLRVDDSHNCIALAVSPQDGRLHVVAGQHNDPMFYTRSYEGFLTDGPWDADVFEPVTDTLAGVAVGQLTYPTFVHKPTGGLLFAYRTGRSANGTMQLAEYEDGAWTPLGAVSSATGTWTAPNGGTSPTRNLYWAHPLYGTTGRLHLTGTWREASQSVLCSPGMITNHHVLYVYSDDDGRTWSNGAGAQVATTDSDPIGVNDPGIHIPSFTSTNLAHQVSDLALGPGVVGILPDYVDPTLLTGSPKCVATMDERFAKSGQGPRWLRDGVWDAEMVRVGGTIVRTGYPTGRKASTRGRLAFAPNGDMVVIFSGLRICSARAPEYTDWTVDEDGANTAYAFGEMAGLDRSREADGFVSVLYMQRDGRMVVRDIRL
jgi:hypothetical protein